MEYADKPELEVIEAARAGDELAMEYLLKHYQGLMSYICDKYYLKDGELFPVFGLVAFYALHKANHSFLHQVIPFPILQIIFITNVTH